MTDPPNPLSPAVLADPYPLYHLLRAEHPVHWIPPFGPWFLTRYADVVTAQRDPRMLKRNFPTAPVDQLPPEMRAELGPYLGILTIDLAYADPPDNSCLHLPLAHALGTRGVESVAPRIDAAIDHLLDQVVEAGAMDMIADFAYPLPTLAGACLLGVPAADFAALRRWSDDVTEVFTGDLTNADIARRAKDAVLTLVDYFRSLLDRRRLEPCDDLISALVCGPHAVRALREDELIALCMQILFSGRGGTPLFFGNGLLALLTHPDQLSRLHDDPSLLPVAIEELLRYDAAPQTIARVAATDIEIAGRRIGAGHPVLLSLAAANRDPAEFVEPDRLDLGRRPNRHLTFGYGGGGHFCVGAPLVRLEARLAFSAVLRRLPGLRLVDAAPHWRANVQERMLQTLRVAFEPSRAEVSP